MKLGQVAIEVHANAGVAGDAECRTMLVVVSSLVSNDIVKIANSCKLLALKNVKGHRTLYMMSNYYCYIVVEHFLHSSS